MTVPSAPSIKIRTLIVDDEPLARSNIAVLLRSDPEIQMIGECGSGARRNPRREA
jgi:two-component system, LytTR family, response regulator